MNNITNSSVKISMLLVCGTMLMTACSKPSSDHDAALSNASAPQMEVEKMTRIHDEYGSLHDPLVTDIYTADPSAHVFNDTLYIYPSHDVESEIEENHHGDHFAMRDYHVLSKQTPEGPAMLHDVALSAKDIPWVGRQLWAPDAATKNGKYYLYFPARDKQDIFRIGVAVSDSPTGPFEAQPQPIAGSYSIDPSVYAAEDGNYYLYFGGIWGGQLQNWPQGNYSKTEVYPADSEPALMPKVAKLSDDMLSIDGDVKDVLLLNEDGTPILHGDNHKRFFEAAWVHKHNGMYYFSYSTGDTHKIAYAVGDNPLGPFTYKGVVLEPVIGWTNHHSIAQFKGQWYLFYHDSSLSKGKTHLRSVKMAPLEHLADGSIKTINAYKSQ